MKDIKIERNALTIAGTTYPATIAQDGESYTITATVEGKTISVDVKPDSEMFGVVAKVMAPAKKNTGDAILRRLTRAEAEAEGFAEVGRGHGFVNAENAQGERIAVAQIVWDAAPVEALAPVEAAVIPEGADRAILTTAGNLVMVEHHEDLTTTAEPVAEVAEAETTTAEPISEADEAEATTAELVEAPARVVPVKDWIGSEIIGQGWRIEFSAVYDRTRVVFDKCPSKAARELCKEFKFAWSPSMKSWNKKLTWKAYRAAQALAEQLAKVC